jgi:hypothetical protein
MHVADLKTATLSSEQVKNVLCHICQNIFSKPFRWNEQQYFGYNWIGLNVSSQHGCYLCANLQGKRSSLFTDDDYVDEKRLTSGPIFYEIFKEPDTGVSTLRFRYEDDRIPLTLCEFLLVPMKEPVGMRFNWDLCLA